MENSKRSIWTVTLIMMGSMTLLFQNCSDVQFSQVVSLNKALESQRIVINDGNDFTNNLQVSLAIHGESQVEMYVTNDSSCETGGQWEPYLQSRTWVLEQKNSQALVFVKFRDESGQETPCIHDDINHDDIGPQMTLLNTPSGFVSLESTKITFSAEDSFSGVERFECTNDVQNKSFTLCETGLLLSDLEEKKYFQLVRAVDRAGNVGDSMSVAWLVDRTKPVVTMENGPGSSTSMVATLKILASDDSSGIDRVECFLDGQPYKNGACSEHMVLENLGVGGHVFVAVAYDRAGNQSELAQLEWKVFESIVLPGFSILGVTGDSDSVIDAWLSAPDKIPTIQWSLSKAGVTYQVSVQGLEDNIECVESTSELKLKLPNCVLLENHQYKVNLSADDKIGGTGVAVPFQFKVDTLAPVIEIIESKMLPDYKSSTSFKIIENNLKLAECRLLKNGKEVNQANCFGKSSIDFENLSPGIYNLEIKAEDQVGHRSLVATEFTVKTIVCDPLSGAGNCTPGLVGNIYYTNQRYSTVDQFIEKGTRADSVIYLPKVFVPTRHFTGGFSDGKGNYLKNNEGERLIEYFALDLKGSVQLGPNDKEGDYEFALLSDDGSYMKIQANGQNVSSMFINNDGAHSTKIACSTHSLTFTKESKIPFSLRYFQGPRTQIAFVMLWRKVKPGQAPDPFCVSRPSGNSTYFGSNYDDFTKKYGYGQLMERGWAPLSEDNFFSGKN